tara:strand:+ start:967 stop:2133 length:1167 start_codon:yes stop_codon:yes gene_type:complete
MADTPKAKNNLSAGALFYQRKLYKLTAYPSGVALPADLWYDKNLYGRINRIQDALVIDPTRLKAIKASDDNGVHVLDFVTDAFRDFRRFYMKKVSSGQLSKRTSIKLKPKKGWIDPQILYHNHMKQVYLKSADLVFSKKHQEISSIETFIPIFIDTIELIAPKTPVSLTSFMTSKYCTPMASGLMIEVDNQSHASDAEKYELWLTDPNFKFYADAARLYGFVVDKNAPWRLVADIFSTTMLNYMQKYGTTKYNCFNTCYYSTHLSDIRKLRSYAYEFYSTFVDANSTLTIPTVEDGKTKLIIGNRSVPSIDEYYDKYKMKFWIEAYYRLRAKEMELNWDETTLRHEARKARKIYKHLDFYSAMDYINDKTKSYYYPETFLRQMPEEEK